MDRELVVLVVVTLWPQFQELAPHITLQLSSAAAAAAAMPEVVAVVAVVHHCSTRDLIFWCLAAAVAAVVETVIVRMLTLGHLVEVQSGYLTQILEAVEPKVLAVLDRI